jgi:hypothetical protein
MNKAKFLYSEHFLEDIGSKMLSFNGLSDFKRLLGPGVYMLCNQKETLYVGMAKNVLVRIADESHSAVRSALKEADQLFVILASGEAHARGIETELIRSRQPKYNVRGKMSPEEVEYYRKQAEKAERERNDPSLNAFAHDFMLALLGNLKTRLG